MGGKIRTLSVLSLVLGLAAVGTLALAIATDYWLFTVEPVTENMFTTEGDGSVPMVSRTLMDFFKILEHISYFCWATDTPVLDFL